MGELSRDDEDSLEESLALKESIAKMSDKKKDLNKNFIHEETIHESLEEYSEELNSITSLQSKKNEDDKKKFDVEKSVELNQIEEEPRSDEKPKRKPVIKMKPKSPVKIEEKKSE
jgi:hypothetical protein